MRIKINKRIFFDSDYILCSLFLIYIISFIISSILNTNIIQYIGFIIYVSLVIVLYFPKIIYLRLNSSNKLAIYIIIYTIINYLLEGRYFDSIDILFKQVFFFLLYIAYYAVYENKNFNNNEIDNYYITIILLLILISCLKGNKFKYEDEIRMSGMFTNPNNFALIGLSLLFFINETGNKIKKILLHIIIILVLFFSGTSGAIIAYFIGMFYKYRNKIFKNIYKYIFIIPAVSIIILYLINMEESKMYFMKLINQFIVLKNILNGDLDIANLKIADVKIIYGSSALSMLWRFQHWQNIISYYLNSKLFNILLGFGLNGSKGIFLHMAHNEYVGFLFEQGVVGFSLIIYFYISIFLNLQNRKKYIIIIFAIYAFSENIVTNMIFMSIFSNFIAKNRAIAEHSNLYS